MNRRGLTMIELLLALSLLAAVVGASAAWIVIAGRISRVAGPAKREAVLQSVLIRLQEDLLTGDFHADDSRANERPRVRVQDNALEIDLRSGVMHIYRLEQSAGGAARLVRVERANGESITRPLLSNVADLRCVINEDGDTLEIMLQVHNSESSDPPTPSSTVHAERTVSQRYRLP